MKFALAVIAIAFLAGPAYGTIYNRCSLAQQLNSMGVAYNELAIWTCIAEHESSYNTAAVGPPNSDGSNDWGLFQINDMYWCAPPSGRYSANGCNVRCDVLTTDDISPDLSCAQQVKNEQGFQAWSTWQYCNGYLPSIDECF